MATVFGGKRDKTPKELKVKSAKSSADVPLVSVEFTETSVAKSFKDVKSELSASQSKLMALLKQIDAVVIERQELNRLTIAAALSGCNLFIGGSPGTGKTHTINTIAKCFDARYRYHLFAPDTMPEDFLGNTELIQYTDSEGVTHTRSHRDLSGGLAQVEFFCADELFKASSPARNAQLGIINEKKYQNGKTEVDAPLTLYAGISNELPQSSQDAAFWDRLAIRYWVKEVSRKGRKTLMMREAGLIETPVIKTTLSMADMEAMKAEAASVKVSEPIIDKILNIVDQASAFNKEISTRKCVQTIKILKAWAYVNGSMEVKRSHLQVLQHVFWGKLSHIEQLQQVCEGELGNQDAALKGVVDKIKNIDVSILYGRSLASTTKNVREALLNIESNQEDFSDKAFKNAHDVISRKLEELQLRLEEEYTI